MQAPVIGLTGPGGVGKSTIAAILADMWRPSSPVTPEDYARAATHSDAVILHIGGPLKDALSTILRHAGLGDAEVHYWIYGGGKRLPCPALHGKTPTEAMQTLGTEWGRTCIDPDFWLSIWAARASQAQGSGALVINDSVRFENEAAAIRDMGGLVFRVVGRSGDLDASHESEKGVIPDFDVKNLEGDGGAYRAAAAIMAAVDGLVDALDRHG